MEKQYRYLINNSVMQGGEMTNRNDYEQSSDVMYHHDLEQWRTSLVKLECSEVELVKILSVFEPDKTIDITSITTVKDGKVYFKEVEGESKPTMPLGFNITVIENNAIKDGNPIMYMSPTDYKKYSDKMKANTT